MLRLPCVLLFQMALPTLGRSQVSKSCSGQRRVRLRAQTLATTSSPSTGTARGRPLRPHRQLCVAGIGCERCGCQRQPLPLPSLLLPSRSQVGAFTRISALTDESTVSVHLAGVHPRGQCWLGPHAGRMVLGRGCARPHDLDVHGRRRDSGRRAKPGDRMPMWLSAAYTFSGAVLFHQYCSRAADVLSVQQTTAWGSEPGAGLEPTLRYFLQVWGSAANSA